MDEQKLSIIADELKNLSRPAWLTNGSYEKWREFALVAAYLLQDRNRTLREASRLGGVKDKTYSRSFWNMMESLEKSVGITFATRIGETQRNRQIIHDDASVKKLIQVLEAILAMGKSGQTVNKELLLARPDVHIGAILSVVNYLTAALVEEIQSMYAGQDALLPSLSFYQGEFAQHFDALLAGDLHFVISTDVSEPLPQDVTKEALGYRAAELGVLFRLKRNSDPSAFHPALERVIGNGRVAKFGKAEKVVDAISSSTVALLNWKMQRTIRREHYEIAKFLSAGMDGAGSKVGQRIFVPTYRTARVLALRGVAITIGHKPARTLSMKKSGRSLDSLGGCVGVDHDFPDSLMGFIPFASLPGFPCVTSTEFFLYYLSKNGNPNPQYVSSSALRVMQTLRQLLAGKTKSLDYLIRDQENDQRLLHDFSPSMCQRPKTRKKPT